MPCVFMDMGSCILSVRSTYPINSFDHPTLSIVSRLAYYSAVFGNSPDNFVSERRCF